MTGNSKATQGADDRLSRAEAASLNTYELSLREGVAAVRQDKREGFMAGVEWADANPQPRTITRTEFLEAVEAHVGLGASGDWVTIEHMLAAALYTLGIEVEGER